MVKLEICNRRAQQHGPTAQSYRIRNAIFESNEFNGVFLCLPIWEECGHEFCSRFVRVCMIVKQIDVSHVLRHGEKFSRSG